MKIIYLCSLLVLGGICCLVVSALSLSLFSSCLTMGYLLLAAVVAYTYRCHTGNYEPGCTVLIPVYNEGEFVLRAISSIAASDYPKLRIVVIDDGSTDDTWQWIEKAKQLHPGIVTIRSPQNEGKKHALYRGLRQSDSEILITVDSDSKVAPDAIRNLVRPFADPKVGAVAGNILVENIKEGLIPRMMDIIFTFSYEFLRSAQSRCGSVLCTPGALSAYRREAVLPVLDEWLGQTFLGEKTRIGEDRALTCLLLRRDWKIVYQESAQAYTRMPVNYSGICRMLLRWVRGDIRENLLLFPFVFRNVSVRRPRSLGLLVHYLAFAVGTVAPAILLPAALGFLLCRPEESVVLGEFFLVVTLLWAFVPALTYARKQSLPASLHSFTYSIFVLLFLSWVPLYALLTLKNNRWLTRNKPAAALPAPAGALKTAGRHARG